MTPLCAACLVPDYRSWANEYDDELRDRDSIDTYNKRNKNLRMDDAVQAIREAASMPPTVVSCKGPGARYWELEAQPLDRVQFANPWLRTGNPSTPQADWHDDWSSRARALPYGLPLRPWTTEREFEIRQRDPRTMELRVDSRVAAFVYNKSE